jgi:hypothetical protein
MTATPKEKPEDAIVDLWIALYGEPPPVRADVSMLVGALVSGLPEPDWRAYLRRGSTSEQSEA